MLLVPFYNPWKHQKHQKTFGEGQFFKRAFIDTFFPGEKKLSLLKTWSINQLILGDADHYKNMHSALTVFILKVKLSHTNLNYNLVYHDMEKHLSLFVESWYDQYVMIQKKSIDKKTLSLTEELSEVFFFFSKNEVKLRSLNHHLLFSANFQHPLYSVTCNIIFIF